MDMSKNDKEDKTIKKYANAINKIDSKLYQSYYDMVYNNLKYMREQKPA
jgi:hypothetical protein